MFTEYTPLLQYHFPFDFPKIKNKLILYIFKQKKLPNNFASVIQCISNNFRFEQDDKICFIKVLYNNPA